MHLVTTSAGVKSTKHKFNILEWGRKSAAAMIISLLKRICEAENNVCKMVSKEMHTLFTVHGV